MSTALLLAVLLAAATAVPDVSGTFSAEINEDFPDGPHNHVYHHYIAHTIEGVKFSKHWFSGGELSRSVNIYLHPYKETIIEPFFDRYLCYTLAGSDTAPIFKIDEDAKLFESGVPCPKGDPTLKCDGWKWWNDNMFYSMHVVSGTNTPVQFQENFTDEIIVTVEFKDWDPTVPDESFFQTPPNTPCSDLSTAAVSGPGRHLSINEARKRFVNDPEIIEQYSKHASTWVPKPSPRFEKMSLDDARKMLIQPGTGSKRVSSTKKAQVPSFSDDIIPEEFDARTQWPNCIGKIRDQESCGSCWAFGATESLSDRICIQKNATHNIPLSPQWLVSCSEKNDGCNGGFLDYVWEDFITMGVASEGCYPYAGEDEACPSKCIDDSEVSLTRTSSAYSPFVAFDNTATVKMIQREIMKNGPVEAAFLVFNDFYSYSHGIYQRTSQTLEGGHAVKLIGWGTDQQTKLPYWLLANSWGKSWGEQGFFRIVRGTDDCMIEDQIACGL